MRILKNIHNEYIVYHSRIQSTELDENKLLAIIIYKNIFPKDFGDLQLNRGFVYNIFVNKEAFINYHKRNIDENIKQNINKIQIIKNEQLNDIDELDALFIVSGHYNLRINSRFDNQFDSRLEFIKEIKKNPQNLEIYSDNYSNPGYKRSNIQPILDEIYKKPQYISRKEIIDQKLNNGIKKLETENEQLSAEKRKLESSKLKDLITKDNIDVLFTFNVDLNNNSYSYILDSKYYPLIKYLIRNGYINETYFDYLTYFYEHSLPRTDKIFLRSVTDEIAKDSTYELKNIEAVVSRLKESDFEKEETLNFDLIYYLVQNNHEYLNPLLKQLKKNTRFDFVFEYLETKDNIANFVTCLNKSWVDIFTYLLYNDEMIDYREDKYIKIGDNHRDNYLISTFHTLYDDIDKNYMKNMNIDNCITSYISNNKEFLDINTSCNLECIISALELLDVRFEYINYEKADKELFGAVYEKNLYKLNFKMISLILKNIYTITSEDDYLRKNYTLVSSRENEPLLKYVNEHIDEYIKVILTNCADNITDSEDCVISILNNAQIIDPQDKKLYLTKLSTVLTSIEKVDQEFWGDLLNLNLIKYSTHNIMMYYFNHANMIDSTLIDFLNTEKDVISFEYGEIKSKFSEINISKFYEEVIQRNRLTTPIYTMILEGFHQNYEKFTFTAIENEKFEKLIDLNIINMTKDNIQFVRANYPYSLIIFISKNIGQYIKCLDKDILDKQEIMNLILETDISDEYKINLLEKYPDEISLQKYDFSEELKLYIIKNKYDSTDLGYLIENYAKSSISMKKEISQKCSSSIELLCNDEMQVSAELLDEIILNSEVDSDYKMNLIYQHLNLLDVPKIMKYMEAIGMNDFVGIFKGNRPKILKNDINDKFLNYFVSKGWISPLKEEKNDSLYYRVRGKNHLGEIEKIESIEL